MFSQWPLWLCDPGLHQEILSCSQKGKVPRCLLPSWGANSLGGTYLPHRALGRLCLSSRMGRKGSSGKLRGEEFPSCQMHSFMHLFIFIFAICRQSWISPLKSRGVVLGGVGMKTGLQESEIAWILPSSAPCGAIDSFSITSLLSFSPNVKLQKMLICLSN